MDYEIYELEFRHWFALWGVVLLYAKRFGTMISMTRIAQVGSQRRHVNGRRMEYVY